MVVVCSGKMLQVRGKPMTFFLVFLMPMTTLHHTPRAVRVYCTSDILVEERRGLHGWIALGYYGLKPYGTEDDKWRPDNAQEVMDKLQLQVRHERECILLCPVASSHHSNLYR